VVSEKLIVVTIVRFQTDNFVVENETW